LTHYNTFGADAASKDKDCFLEETGFMTQTIHDSRNQRYLTGVLHEEEKNPNCPIVK
jgi:hypothetical protein